MIERELEADFVLVCIASRDPACGHGCGERGRDLILALETCLDATSATPPPLVIPTGCLGECAEGPTVVDVLARRAFTCVTIDDAAEVAKSIANWRSNREWISKT